MKVVAVAIWLVAAVIAISFVNFVRRSVRSGAGVTQQTVNQTMLLVVSVVAVPLVGLSPFHLVWMFPAGWLLGMLSLAFPFSLLSLAGQPFGSICCLGLDRDEIGRNQRRLERLRSLLAEGMSPEDAKNKLREEQP